jgi:hypothetical protein
MSVETARAALVKAAEAFFAAAAKADPPIGDAGVLAMLALIDGHKLAHPADADGATPKPKPSRLWVF